MLSNFVHVLWRLAPLSFGRFGRWRCRLDFGSVFYCMSSSSFASVRRLVLFRVRQNQVTKNLFSNSSAGLAIISAQFRNSSFDGVFSFRFRLIVLRVLRFSAHSFLNRSISVSRESEWVFFICCILVFIHFNQFCRLWKSSAEWKRCALCVCCGISCFSSSVMFLFFTFVRLQDVCKH